MKDNINNRERIIYIELLRIVACVAVIFIHVIAGLIKYYNMGTANWNVLMVISSSIRWCIPLFFMISGKVFLDREKAISWKLMLKKYIKRMVIVLIVWGSFYYLFDMWIYGQSVEMKSIALLIVGLFVGTNGYHLWYLYGLIVLYLFIPILKLVVDNISRKDLKYLIVVICFLTSVCGLANEVLGETIQIYIAGSKMLGYIGCALIGYYISVYSIHRRTRMFLNVMAMFSAIIIPIGNYFLSVSKNELCLEFAEYTGIFVMIIASWILVKCKNSFQSVELKCENQIRRVANKTFGIYLIHVIFVSIIFHKLPIDWGNINWVVSIPISVGVFLVSYVIICGLKKKLSILL